MHLKTPEIVEPIFGQVYLVDLSVRRRVSSVFHFDINSDRLRQRLVSSSHLLASREWGPATRARTATFVLPPSLTDSLYFVCRVEKTLHDGGQKFIENCYATLQKGKKADKARDFADAFLSALGSFRTPIAFLFWPLCGAATASALDMDPAGAGKTSRDLPIKGIVNEALPTIYRYTKHFSDEAIFDAIGTERDGRRTGKTLPLAQVHVSQHALAPGVQVAGEVDAHLRPLRTIDPPTLSRRDKFPIRRQILLELPPDAPFSTRLDHILYVYPLVLDLSKAPRKQDTLVVRVRVVATDRSRSQAAGLPVILGRTTCQSLETERYTTVQYRTQRPRMYDEIAIVLPLRLTAQHHLLFEVAHIDTKVRATGKEASKAPKKVEPLFVGFTALPLLENLPRLLEQDTWTLPFLPITVDSGTQCSERYLSHLKDPDPKQKYLQGRATLTLRLVLRSTVHEVSLSQQRMFTRFNQLAANLHRGLFQEQASRAKSDKTGDRAVQDQVSKLKKTLLEFQSYVSNLDPGSASQAALRRGFPGTVRVLLHIVCGAHHELTVPAFETMIRVVEKVCVEKLDDEITTVFHVETFEFLEWFFGSAELDISPFMALDPSKPVGADGLYVAAGVAGTARPPTGGVMPCARTVHEAVLDALVRKLQLLSGIPNPPTYFPTHLYFVFSLIIKSVTLHLSQQKKLFGSRKGTLPGDFLKNLRSLTELMVQISRTLSVSGVAKGRQINRYFALFMHDLLGIMDRGLVFGLILQYVLGLDSNTPNIFGAKFGEPGTSQFVRADLLKTEASPEAASVGAGRPASSRGSSRPLLTAPNLGGPGVRGGPGPAPVFPSPSGLAGGDRGLSLRHASTPQLSGSARGGVRPTRSVPGALQQPGITKAELVRFKLDFLRVIMQHDQYVPLNLPVVGTFKSNVDGLAERMMRAHFPAALLVQHVVLTLVQQQKDRIKQAVEILRDVLIRHDDQVRSGKLVQPVLNHVAIVYFPLFLLILRNYRKILSQPKEHSDTLIRSWMLCFLWVLQSTARSFLGKWWQQRPKLMDGFFESLQICVTVFEYLGKAKLAERAKDKAGRGQGDVAERSLTQLETRYGTQRRTLTLGSQQGKIQSFRRRAGGTRRARGGAGASSSSDPDDGPGASKGSGSLGKPGGGVSTGTHGALVGRKTGGRNLREKTKTVSSRAGVQFDTKTEGFLSTQTTLLILDVLDHLLETFQDPITKTRDPVAVGYLSRTCHIVSELLRVQQSAKALSSLVDTVYMILRTYGTFFYKERNGLLKILLPKLMVLLGFQLQSHRQFGQLLVYLVFRGDWECTQTLRRSRIQAAYGLNLLEFTESQVPNLHRSLSTLRQYAAEDKRIASTLFKKELNQTLENFEGVLSSVGYITRFSLDSELCQKARLDIANRYKLTPALRYLWLQKLCKAHFPWELFELARNGADVRYTQGHPTRLFDADPSKRFVQLAPKFRFELVPLGTAAPSSSRASGSGGRSRVSRDTAAGGGPGGDGVGGGSSESNAGGSGTGESGPGSEGAAGRGGGGGSTGTVRAGGATVRAEADPTQSQTALEALRAACPQPYPLGAGVTHLLMAGLIAEYLGKVREALKTSPTAMAGSDFTPQLVGLSNWKGRDQHGRTQSGWLNTGYLESCLPASFTAGFRMLPLSPKFFDETAEPQVKIQDEGVLNEEAFSLDNLVLHLERAVAFLRCCSLYEVALEVYRILLGIYAAQRRDKELARTHADMALLHRMVLMDRVRVASKQLSAIGQRPFGVFYFVGHYGPAWKRLDMENVSVVYHEPYGMGLFAFKERLVKRYRHRLDMEGSKDGEGRGGGPGSGGAGGSYELVVLQTRSMPKPDEYKNPGRLTMQIFEVFPHFKADELERRQTPYDRWYGTTYFVQEAVYTKDPGGDREAVTQQCLQEILITTEYPFPSVLRRVRVVKPPHVTNLTPIENAIRAIRAKNHVLEVLLEASTIMTLQAQLNGAILPQVNAGPASLCGRVPPRPLQRPDQGEPRIQQTHEAGRGATCGAQEVAGITGPWRQAAHSPSAPASGAHPTRLGFGGRVPEACLDHDRSVHGTRWPGP